MVFDREVQLVASVNLEEENFLYKKLIWEGLQNMIIIYKMEVFRMTFMVKKIYM